MVKPSKGRCLALAQDSVLSLLFGWLVGLFSHITTLMMGTEIVPKTLVSTLLRFIETYMELTVLWDTLLKEYSNREKKNMAYDELQVIYEDLKKYATREDVKRKINSLRTNYRKELKKIEKSKRSGSDVDDVSQPKCWLFKELSFLQKSEGFVAHSISSINREVSCHKTYMLYISFILLYYRKC
jgi:hypothetical protein